MNKMAFLVIFVLCSLVAQTPLYAAQTEHQQASNRESILTTADTDKKPPVEAKQYPVNVDESLEQYKQQEKRQVRADRKFYAVLLAILSLVSMFVVLYLMRSASPSAEDIVLVMGLNFVIFGTIISVLIIDTNEQLSAVTGILGAMGGYLFGSKGRGTFGRKSE
jgi:hypothetical protein